MLKNGCGKVVVGTSVCSAQLSFLRDERPLNWDH
jgi:hypothetical protein